MTKLTKHLYPLFGTPWWWPQMQEQMKWVSSFSVAHLIVVAVFLWWAWLAKALEGSGSFGFFSDRYCRFLLWWRVNFTFGSRFWTVFTILGGPGFWRTACSTIFFFFLFLSVDLRMFWILPLGLDAWSFGDFSALLLAGLHVLLCFSLKKTITHSMNCELLRERCKTPANFVTFFLYSLHPSQGSSILLLRMPRARNYYESNVFLL